MIIGGALGVLGIGVGSFMTKLPSKYTLMQAHTIVTCLKKVSWERILWYVRIVSIYGNLLKENVSKRKP